MSDTQLPPEGASPLSPSTTIRGGQFPPPGPTAIAATVAATLETVEDAPMEYISEPTLTEFHQDDSFVRGVMGPFGSGKSVAMCMEILTRAQNQAPFGKRRIRKTRWACVRNTYPELRTTTIKTWQEWVPEDIAPIKFDAPITCTLKVTLPDGTRMHCEVFFLALDQEKDVKKLKSLELTGAWLNEASELTLEALEAVTGRVGRYPRKSEGGPTWSGVFMDTNPPDDLHWYYELAEKEKPKGYKFFKQPPALLYDSETKEWTPNPNAENVRNQSLGYEYWLRMVPGKKRSFTKAYVEGKYSSNFKGKPVYDEEWDEDEHVLKEAVKPITNQQIVIGVDFGLNPAAAFMQLQGVSLIVLEECAPQDVSLEDYCEDFLRPIIFDKFKGCQFIICGDPAGLGRSPIDKRTPFQVIQKALGIKAVPAWTNNFIQRRDAVTHFLMRRQGFALNPHVHIIREGFNGGYHYPINAATKSRRVTPEKNGYSHPHDGLQYGCLYVRGNKGRSAGASRKQEAGWTS